MSAITDNSCQQLSYGYGKSGKVAGQMTFADLIKAAENPSSVDKTDAQWFIASPAPGRKKDQVAGVPLTVLPLDFDAQAQPLTLDKLIAELDDILHGNAALIYSTASSTPENPRWRVCLPLASPVDAVTYTAMQTALQGFFAGQGLELDGSMKSPSQVSFMPNILPTASGGSGFYEYRLINGKLLDWTDCHGNPPIFNGVHL